MTDADDAIEQKIPESLSHRQISTIIQSFECNGYRVVLECSLSHGMVLRAYRRSADPNKENVAPRAPPAPAQTKRRIVPTLISDIEPTTGPLTEVETILKEAPEMPARFCTNCGKNKEPKQFVIKVCGKRSGPPQMREYHLSCLTCRQRDRIRCKKGKALTVKRKAESELGREVEEVQSKA